MASPRFHYDSQGALFPTDESKLAFFFAEFCTRFPTEADCLEELYKRAIPLKPHTCRHCGYSLSNRQYGDRVSKCQSCNRQTWHTAGTFFEGIRVAKPWLAAIWLMEKGVALSSSRLAKLADIAQSTALNLLHKLRTVIRKHMEHNAPSAYSSLFSAVFRKRSSATPAYAHPRAEQEEIDKTWPHQYTVPANDKTATPAAALAADIDTIRFGHPDLQYQQSANPDNSSNQTETFESTLAATSYPGRERQVFGLLSEEPIHFDKLCELTGLGAAELSASLVILQLSDLIAHKEGDYYMHCKLKSDADPRCLAEGDDGLIGTTAAAITAAIRFIVEHSHGISRKYLQNYLAAYWCYNDRKTWSRGALLQLCHQSKAISTEEMRKYISPPVIKLVSGSD